MQPADLKKKSPLARSGASVGLVLTALAAVAPEAPWYAFAGLAALVVIVEAVFRPSVRVKDVADVVNGQVEARLPRADEWKGQRR